MVVEVRRVLGQYRHQMAVVDDQDPVEQVVADSSGGWSLSGKPDELVAQRGLGPTVASGVRRPASVGRPGRLGEARRPRGLAVSKGGLARWPDECYGVGELSGIVQTDQDCVRCSVVRGGDGQSRRS